jgi:hypothetical protein
MSSIQMNVTKADVWWVTCQLCDFETKQTPDQEKAERKRLEHFRHHEALSAQVDAEVGAVAEAIMSALPRLCDDDRINVPGAADAMARAALDATLGLGWKRAPRASGEAA